MAITNFDHRRFLAATAAASAATVVAPFVRTSHASGTLNVGFWDHWVPGANDVLISLCNEWVTKEKVDIKIDYITSQGSKIILTIASEAQANRVIRSGLACCINNAICQA